MTAPYSVDLRERVVELKLTGEYTNQEIADIFIIGITSVKEYVRKFKNGESLVPEKPGGRKPSLTEVDKKLIASYVKNRPDATLQDYRDQLESDTGTDVTIQSIHGIIKNLDISFKKKVTMRKSKIDQTLKKSEKTLSALWGK